jgi:polyhydroxyalkanoate synthase
MACCTPANLEMKNIKKTIENIRNILSGKLKEEACKMVGSFPSDTVLTEKRVKLLRFRNAGITKKHPVLFIPSMINRYYILDLLPRTSVIAKFVEAGYDTYLIEWGNPSLGDERVPFEWYVPEFIDKALRKIALLTGRKSLHIFGYCMGGTMALLYAALRPEKVQTLGLIAAPVDFSKSGILGIWSDPRYFDAGSFIKPYFNIPYEVLHFAFGLVKPSWQVKQIPAFFQMLSHKTAMIGYYAVSKWTGDNVDVPNLVFKKYAEDCYQGNKLIKGEFMLGKGKVNLKNIRCPLYAIAAEHDFLVPFDSSFHLKDFTGSSDITEKVYPTGHIGISVGPLAMNVVWKDALDWIDRRDSA